MTAPFSSDLPTSREDCLEADEKDTLSAYRYEFDLPGDVIYLDENSLGARPRAALERAGTVIDREWGQGLSGAGTPPAGLICPPGWATNWQA